VRNKKKFTNEFAYIPLEEKETIIRINNGKKSIELWTCDQKIWKRFTKILGQADHYIGDFIHKRIKNQDVSMIWACSWFIDYETEREKAKKILSTMNLLPRKKKER
jgi:hypothetical protein